MTASSHQPWWRTAVIYQLYVRSFADSNGDGVGDLEGIRQKLPYLADLGVDGIWLTPCYPSPQWDHGYDVADYFDINPEYGSLATFDALVADATVHGIRIMMDVVPNHCSWDHDWFKAALAAKPGSRERERFYFRDGCGPNGDEPPNNWRCIFGGPAWTRVPNADGSPGQWYLHVFTPQQPDLNWTNPDVPDMFDDMLRFWFDRGVEGFRCDAVTVLGKTSGLPDVQGEWVGDDREIGGENPHFTWLESGHVAWRRWRQTVDQYQSEHPGRELVMVAEAYTPGRPDILRQYVNHQEFHQTFAFDLLLAPWSAKHFRVAIDSAIDALTPDGILPTWTNNNHDAQRTVTRYGRADSETFFSGNNLLNSNAVVDFELGQRRSRAAALMMLALPGSAYLYAGEELGLPEVLDIEDGDRQDPIFIRTNGDEIGRDGCRVPLPWTADPGTNFGFSDAGDGSPQPAWMPQPADWGRHAAAAQDADDRSPLHLYRRAITQRRSLTDLTGTSLEWRGDLMDAHPQLLAFSRGSVTVVVNLAERFAPLPDLGRCVIASDLMTSPRTIPGNTAAWFVSNEGRSCGSWPAHQSG
jgi:alpha-glucosidase